MASISDSSGGVPIASTAHETPSGSTNSGQAIVEVPVLRIQAEDWNYSFIKLRSTTDGISLSSGDLHLGHVPNVYPFWRSKSTRETHVCIRAEIPTFLTDTGFLQFRAHVPGTYYMMIAKLEKTPQDPAPVAMYGDLFVFKVSREHDGSNGKVEFDQVPAEMITMRLARSIYEQIGRGWEGGTMERRWLSV